MWVDEKFKIIQKKIKKLSDSSIEVLDLGARDQILKQFLTKNCIYTGVDKFKNNNDNLIINLDENFNSINKEYDVVCALDIIEHVHDPLLFLSNCKQISKRLIYVNIPNVAYYSFRLKFLLFGDLTNKFHFSGNSKDDRHRWFTNYKNTLNFIKIISDEKYEINIDMVYKTRNKLFFLYIIEKLLGKFFPGLFCWSFLLTIKKK